MREYQEEIARLKDSLSPMPSSYSVITVNDADRETIPEEYRAESEGIIAKTEAEMEKLRLNNHQSAKERAVLQKNLEIVHYFTMWLPYPREISLIIGGNVK